jgi:hypothetical protein
MEFSFLVLDEKTEGSELNGSKHYENSVPPYFPLESIFDFLHVGCWLNAE